MKQEIGSKNCLAIVGCMITNTQVADFEKICGKCPDDGYHPLDLYKFLIRYDIVLGVGYNIENVKIGDNTDIIETEFNIRSMPAFVSVASDNYAGKKHAIYWDGKQIFDPNPLVEDGLPLSYYKIDTWFPIDKKQEYSKETQTK
jgi:hypothetical protein